MNNLEWCLTNRNPQEIADVLNEQGLSIGVDWREEDEAIVSYFSEKVRGQLTHEGTPDNDLVIRYKDKSVPIGLQEEPADRDRTLQAIRDIIQEDYEIRVLKSSLDWDTFVFVVEERATWQKLDAEQGELISQLFVAFTYEVRFWE